jgi:hypothetical protein
MYTCGDAVNSALWGTQLAAAELLLQMGAKPGDSVMLCAVESAKPVAACRLVLQYGAKDTAGNIALHLAAQEHKQGAVQVLLAANQHSMSHTEKTSRLEAALTGAARGGNIQLVQELLTSLDHHLAEGGKESADARVRALTNALQAVQDMEQSRCKSWLLMLQSKLKRKRMLFGAEEAECAVSPSDLPVAEWDRVAEVLTEAKQAAQGKHEQVQGDATVRITVTAATGGEK